MTIENYIETLKGDNWEEFKSNLIESEKEYLEQYKDQDGWVIFKNRKHNGKILDLEYNPKRDILKIIDWED